MIKMITCLKEEDLTYYKNFLEPSAKKFQLYLFQTVTKKDTKDEGEAKKYNLAVEAMFSNNMAEDNDIVVFIREDVGIVDQLFKDKIEMIFNEKPDVGLVGIMGSSQVSKSVEWWMNPPESLRGQILQGTKEEPGKGEHLVKGPVGFYTDVVTVDKCFMAMRASLLRELTFDDSICSDELYNTDMCLQVLNKGYKIAVADILLHQAKHPENKSQEDDWNATREKLIEKWVTTSEFPITVDSFKGIEKSDILRPEVMEIEL